MAFPAITLAEITNLLVVLFVVATMFSLGLGLTIWQIARIASRFNLMGRALLVNIVLIPLLAYVLVRVLPTNPQLAIGVLLMAMAPGAAFGPKMVQIARAYIPLAVGLVAIVAVLIVFTLPATAALILPGETVIDSMALVQSMVLVEIIPLAFGLALHQWWRPVSRALRPWVTRASTVLFVLVVLATIVVSLPAFPSLLQIPSILAALGTMAGSILLGYWLGGPGVETRRALAITSLSRYAGIALFVADSSFPDPHVRAMIVAYGTIGVIVGAALALIWGHQARIPTPEAVPEEREARGGRAA
ncbi:MAG TPA: bile acid:sodium symporter [Chloroflexota bacterium]|nr:bile acid:sodium symporter [Chloroflexota bacterium]